MLRRVARPHGTVVVVGTFALLSLVPVVALGFLLGKAVNSGVQQENLTAANKTAVILAQTGIQPLLTPSDLTTGLSETRRADLDMRLHAVAFGHVIARLKIWNRQNVVVYSDNPSLIGKAFPADENLEKALAGNAASEISDATAPENRADSLRGRFLSVYVPIIFEGNPPVVSGAFEIYLPWQPVADAIDQQSQRLYLLLAVGLGLLYLSMIPVVLVAEGWRRRLSASLGSIEEERRRSEESARVSQLKSSFLAFMSHEMRTPLNAVLGFTQLLRSPGFDALTERQDRYVQNIALAGRHLLALTNDVLDLSKIEAGKMEMEIEDIHLRPVLEEAAEILRPLSEAKSLSVSVAIPELVVSADRLRLTQVLVNLLSNAVKFTPENGAIEVSARTTSSSVELEVSDTGCGISPADQAAVFEDYKQAGGSRAGGTGLGLPLSRRLIELMGGELLLLSSSPQGSTFRIRIPSGTRAEAPSAEPAAGVLSR